MPRSDPLPMVIGIRDAAAGAFILAATLAAYWPARCGDVLWDDDRYVSQNPLLLAEGGLWSIWTRPQESPQYYPLVFTSFWLEARLWGLSAFGLHLVNVLLHAANALLVWHVLRRLKVPGAWLAGALFALHPVHVESVAWITERKNVLSGLFYLLSCSFYLRFWSHGRRSAYALALVFFVGALLSKTVTCTLPLAVLLCTWWKQGRVSGRDILHLLPFLALGAVLALFTVWLEKHHVGAMGEPWRVSALERALVAGRAWWFYVGKLVWPADLSFNYPRWDVNTRAIWQYAFPLAALSLLVVMWLLRARLGKGPFVAVVIFSLTLAPALGFFNVYPFRFSYVADHFQYHASIALLALFAGSAAVSLRHVAGRRESLRSWLPRAAWVLPLICGLLTLRQAGDYVDSETLWRRTIAANPASWLARENLALLLLRDHADDAAAVEEAREHFERVTLLNPRFVDPHINLGIIAGRQGRHAEAVAHYQAALHIDPDNALVHYNLARELYRGGDAEGAIAAYRRCLELDPGGVPAHVGLGRVLLERGEFEAAQGQFQRALELDPENAWALHNIGVVAENAEHYAEAIELYRQALAANPDLVDSWYRMAVCYQQTRRRDAAEAAYRRTLELSPTHTGASAGLAALAGMRDQP